MKYGADTKSAAAGQSCAEVAENGANDALLKIISINLAALTGGIHHAADNGDEIGGGHVGPVCRGQIGMGEHIDDDALESAVDVGDIILNREASLLNIQETGEHGAAELVADGGADEVQKSIAAGGHARRFGGFIKKAAGLLPDEGGGERVFIGEVLVEGADAHPCLLGNGVGGETLKPVGL